MKYLLGAINKDTNKYKCVGCNSDLSLRKGNQVFL